MKSSSDGGQKQKHPGAVSLKTSEPVFLAVGPYNIKEQKKLLLSIRNVRSG